MEVIINKLIINLSISSSNLNNSKNEKQYHILNKIIDNSVKSFEDKDKISEKENNENLRYHLINIFNHKKQLYPKDFINFPFKDDFSDTIRDEYNKYVEDNIILKKDKLIADLWMVIGAGNRDHMNTDYTRFKDDYDIAIEIDAKFIDSKNENLLALQYNPNTRWPYIMFETNLKGKFSKIILDTNEALRLDEINSIKNINSWLQLLSINGILYIPEWEQIFIMSRTINQTLINTSLDSYILEYKLATDYYISKLIDKNINNNTYPITQHFSKKTYIAIRRIK